MHRRRKDPAAQHYTLAGLIPALGVAAALGSMPAPAQDIESPDRPSIGLVLSGGGARGGAHVGVLKVLDEMRIPVDFIAGTSMGAIVGGLYAAGLSASQLEQVVVSADWSYLLTDKPPRAERSFRRKGDDDGFLVNFDIGIDKNGLILPAGFLQGQNLEIALKRQVLPVMTVDNFDQLPIPFRAVATDIVTGAAVPIRSGNLATAMRASMSAPGVFKPVRLDGRILVDGGVANNLPVQVVRDMGAEVLIVVDVGFPLLAESELESALDVTKQMLTILINARSMDQAALLAPHDVLIRPELGSLKSEAFDRLGEAQVLGAEKAVEFRQRLSALSISTEAYAAHRAKIASRLRSPPVIKTVSVKNESKLSPEVIRARLSEHRGKPLDIDLLEADIVDIYGFDTFETVTYDIADTEQGAELSIQGTEKSWGPNYLRLGINLEDNFEGDSRYNIAARFTQTEINRKGGELRAELQLGETPRLFAEWYQPLDYASRWFINPQIAFERATSGLFDEGRQLARFRSDQSALTLDGGRQFGNWGELRFGITRSFSNSKLQIGEPAFDGGSADFTTLQASIAHDTIDNLAIPRSGTNYTLVWAGARESLDSDGTFDLASAFLLKPQTWGKNTLLHWWEFGSTLNDKTPGITPFSLGGLFTLSGYAPDELSGKHAGMGRLLYYRRLGDQALRLLDTTVYVGASVEAGNVWQRSSDISLDNTLLAGSVFVIFDTILGPLYVAYGAAEGNRESAYLFLGQTF